MVERESALVPDEPESISTAAVLAEHKYFVNLTPMFKLLYWSVVLMVVVVIVVLGNLAVHLVNKERKEQKKD